MNRVRLVLVAVGAAAVAAVLWRLGLAGPVDVDWSDPIGWLSSADPLDAISVVLAGAGFVLCVYLAVVSGLSFLASGLRLGWLTRFVNRLTVPPLRRLLRLGVIGGVLASTVGGTIMAAPAGGTPNVRHAPRSATESDAAVVTTSTTDQAAAPLSGVAPTRPASVDASAAWTVAEGQSWWSISKATMGRGELWQELQRINVGREVAPGVVLSDETALVPGMVLAVPNVPAPKPVDVASGRWIVQPGDTLARIATQVYGDRADWVRVWEANRGRSFAGRTFSNPNVLGVGWDLTLPGIVTAVTPPPTTEAPPTAAPAPSVPSTVTVERDDTLAVIARRVYGDGTRWPTIWEANQGLEMAEGRIFADPDQLDVGWQLVVPPLPIPTPVRAAVPASHTVASGDTLWDIAAGHYGRQDPALVGMVFEANRGVTDPDGRILHDPDLINPGMELTLPADPTVVGLPAATVVPPPPSPAPAPVDTPVHHPPPAAPSPPPADLTPMPATEPPPAPDVSTPPASASDLPGPVDVGVLPAATGADTPEESAPSRFAGGLAAATLLATGALTLVDARRRRQLQRMGQNDVLSMPDPDLAPTQAAMRAGSDAVGIARLDIALRALAARAASRDPNAEAVRPELVVRHGSGRIEVHLQRVPSGDPPEPWVAEDPRVWVLPPAVPTADLVAAAQDVPPPCPALVMLGRSGPAEIYLDLEAAGILRLDGPPEHVVALARALVASLAVSPLADVVQVVSTGVDVYGFANEERVDAVGDPSEALGLAQAATGSTRAVMDEQHVASTFALRAAARSEPWEPTMVLLLRSAMAPSQVADLAGLVGEGGRGLAVVTDQPVATARWHLAIAEGRRWRLGPVGLTLEPIGLAADELADLGAVLHDAKTAPVTRPTTPPPVAPWGPPVVADPGPVPAVVTNAVAVPVPDVTPGEPFVEPGWAVQVRIMGPVEVVNPKGKVARFERSRSLELVVWVAQHPTNASRVAARTAIWESDVRDTSFNNVVSEARRALSSLGLPPDGDEWMPKSATDRLTLHPLVVTDADLIRQRYEHARHQPHHLAIDILRDALELVRDVPYAGTNWLWPDGEGLPSNLTLLAVNAATEMAQRCLQTGDIDAVFWATSLGLRVLPGHDELVCLRMRAHGARGDLAGVRSEYLSYDKVITNDPWGDATPSPKVVECRNLLLRGHRAAD